MKVLQGLEEGICRFSYAWSIPGLIPLYDSGYEVTAQQIIPRKTLSRVGAYSMSRSDTGIRRPCPYQGNSPGASGYWYVAVLVLWTNGGDILERTSDHIELVAYSSGISSAS